MKLPSLVLLVVASCWATQPLRLNSAEPVHLIFDTDIGNDVDDALALGVIHALQSRGECELLAVVTTQVDFVGSGRKGRPSKAWRKYSSTGSLCLRRVEM